ncbi:RING-H2 finger protein ATL52-like [Papaver somniferum]|uniref:RING-H2 finger protein ATL52-like n=1 Tax=Papaver somniferum TaxID=3469 RepID=UPI000E6FA79A|nr:RING-H2 finger protein ATL52-like [Papaver somniferum]
MGEWENMKPSDQTSQLVFKPLMISMVGIAFTALAIVTYQFIITKYCVRRRESMLERNELRSHQAMVNRGVDENVLKAIPIITYHHQQQQQGRDDEEEVFCVDQTECSVCLGDLQEGDMLRLLPNCKHVFHVPCIDQWWLTHSTCPICRSPVTGRNDDSVCLQIQAEGDEEGLVSHQHHQEQQYNCSEGSNNNEGGSSSIMVGSKLRHCVSLIWPANYEDEVRKQQSLPKTVLLKRSMSVDCSFVCIKIQPRTDSSSSSSSTWKTTSK